MADLDSVERITKIIGDILDLVPDAFDLYLVGLQLAPTKLPGFMGFVTNPAAVPLGISSGVPQPSNLLVTITETPNTPVILIGTPMTFNASVPGGVPPIVYHWDFGDGFSSTSSMPGHTYSAVGTYTVTLIVQDGQGNVGYGKATVTIAYPVP